MDIQKKEVLIAEIEKFKEEALKMHIVQVLADTYTNTSLFDFNIDSDGSVIWYRDQARQLWDFWQTSKTQVPEGFVLVDNSELEILKSDKDQLTKSCIDWTDRAYKQREKVAHIKNKVEVFKRFGASLDLGLRGFLDNLIELSTFKHDAEFDGFVLLPIEPSKAIKTALSYQCFEFIKVAQIYRDHGFDIPKKAEHEQSFFLHKFLILAIKHGDDFIKIFNDETKAMTEAGAKS